jgi:uncharacterized repeat protein (TIGR03803 family)
MRSTIVAACAVSICLAAGLPAPAQTLTTLYNFTGGPDGSGPQGVTIHDTALYGATFTGGSNGLGTVFAFDLHKVRGKTLYSFQGGADGAQPLTGVVYRAGKVYGTTSQAGQLGTGTVFAIDVATGQETTLYNFSGPLDAEPDALTISNNTLFGTTGQNGQNGYGIAFAIDLTTGKEKTLHAFRSLRKGRTPAGSVLSANGVLFGTTSAGCENAIIRTAAGIFIARWRPAERHVGTPKRYHLRYDANRRRKFNRSCFCVSHHRWRRLVIRRRRLPQLRRSV